MVVRVTAVVAATNDRVCQPVAGEDCPHTHIAYTPCGPPSSSTAGLANSDNQCSFCVIGELHSRWR